MEIHRATLDTCAMAEGMVVVIDVLRAFTTAAFAFAAGAVDITLVATVEQALSLRERIPGALAMGEVEGLPVDGFDLNNSPAALLGRDLSGQRLIHRSTAGTQGVVRAVKADALLAASLCNVGATVRHIRRKSPSQVALVQTGVFPGGRGDEDVACADLIEGLLLGRPPDVPSIIERVRNSQAGRRFTDPSWPDFCAADLECAIDIDRFGFALVVEREDGLLLMRPVH